MKKEEEKKEGKDEKEENWELDIDTAVQRSEENPTNQPTNQINRPTNQPVYKPTTKQQTDTDNRQTKPHTKVIQEGYFGSKNTTQSIHWQRTVYALYASAAFRLIFKYSLTNKSTA